VTHILDNPIWNALHTSNHYLYNGNATAVYMKRDVGFFAGLKNNTVENLHSLYELLREKSLAVLFTPEPLPVIDSWTIKMDKPLLQLLYQGHSISAASTHTITPLNDSHIPEMLALTKLTNPGPFLSRSIDFGNYFGVIENGKLIAMTGQRLRPDPYTEVSAVCTHPDHLGKGYARTLVINQINYILNAGRLPFLHVFPDNTGALRLYEKLGFAVRKTMRVTVLERE
jgi:predicted GNAT family acetyltransferase